jgi:hypothetical protein
MAVGMSVVKSHAHYVQYGGPCDAMCFVQLKRYCIQWSRSLGQSSRRAKLSLSVW